MRMRIKIVRRETYKGDDCWDVSYDIYHGFGYPLVIPIFTRWVLDKSGLSEFALSYYLTRYLTSVGKYKIVSIVYKEGKK